MRRITPIPDPGGSGYENQKHRLFLWPYGFGGSLCKLAALPIEGYECEAKLKKAFSLVLFDMDGTLVNVMEIHKAGFARTMQKIWGVNGFPRNVDRQGKPQLQSLREVCLARNIPEELIAKRMPEAAKFLSATTVGLLPDDLRKAVLPGVLPLLDHLEQAGLPLVLVTGTLRNTASAILERAGLKGYFRFFISGEMGQDRRQLVEQAIQWAEKEYTREFPTSEIVSIGDSPNDIRTARSLGIKIIAVATGLYNLEELSKFEPDILLPNLLDLQASIRAISGDRPVPSRWENT